MVVLHEMRRRARFLVWPFAGLALTTYFIYHTFEGERGLRAWREIAQQLRIARDNLAATEAERDALLHKVSGLEPAHVDPDLLDQQVRSNLDLIAPNEIVIMHRGQPR
ncbi:MAG TPA: septum formation initiator family protein [Stellaceae bacterium]|jgi:cell division protein FtsB|nr:septum formation initiator family protein [Stellaceae bacterium]